MKLCKNCVVISPLAAASLRQDTTTGGHHP
ncbi:uncharacterized protein METZ01_LOCUS322784, partial [marine metagenome]